MTPGYDNGKMSSGVKKCTNQRIFTEFLHAGKNGNHRHLSAFAGGLRKLISEYEHSCDSDVCGILCSGEPRTAVHPQNEDHLKFLQCVRNNIGSLGT